MNKKFSINKVVAWADKEWASLKIGIIGSILLGCGITSYQLTEADPIVSTSIIMIASIFAVALFSLIFVGLPTLLMEYLPRWKGVIALVTLVSYLGFIFI